MEATMPKNIPTVKIEMPAFSFDEQAWAAGRARRRDSNEAKVLTLMVRAAERLGGPLAAEELYLEALELSLQETGYRGAICAARSAFDNHVPNMLAHRPKRGG
jgi:hypothetical protein